MINMCKYCNFLWMMLSLFLFRFGYCDECRASKDATSSCASSSHPAAASSGNQAAAASSQAATASTSSSHGNTSVGHHTQQIHRVTILCYLID